MEINHTVIQKTFDTLSDISLKEKKKALSENERNNEFLDKILDFKKVLNKRVNLLDNLIEQIETITWYNDFTDEDLIKISTIIDLAIILEILWKKEYAIINKEIKSKNIAKKEIIDFKNALDDFREIYKDLSHIVFKLSKDSEFNNLTEMLLLID